MNEEYDSVEVKDFNSLVDRIETLYKEGYRLTKVINIDNTNYRIMEENYSFDTLRLLLEFSYTLYFYKSNGEYYTVTRKKTEEFFKRKYEIKKITTKETSV